MPILFVDSTELSPLQPIREPEDSDRSTSNSQGIFLIKAIHTVKCKNILPGVNIWHHYFHTTGVVTSKQRKTKWKSLWFLKIHTRWIFWGGAETSLFIWEIFFVNICQNGICNPSLNFVLYQ